MHDRMAWCGIGEKTSVQPKGRAVVASAGGLGSRRGTGRVLTPAAVRPPLLPRFPHARASAPSRLPTAPPPRGGRPHLLAPQLPPRVGVHTSLPPPKAPTSWRPQLPALQCP
eukprot:360130-Chlamydomonas_euryale.AAC.1